MSYQVIARKYRPQRFEEVVGQDHVIRTLVNAIKQNRIAHAYLFCGPRGTGKTTIARIFAKCLNCTNGPRVDFDDNDPICREIAEGRSLDVLEIDGASNRGIDEVRQLRETVKYTPASSRYKIFIIDEVHMLTREAFNALLKTLEEPPPHVKFMFATTEPEKIPPTILSRCQRFDLRRIPDALIAKHLKWICEKENVQIEEAALFAIARLAEGCMRDAQSALDQLISFCGNKIDESQVLTMFGLPKFEQIYELTKAILTGDKFTILQIIDQLAEYGKDYTKTLTELVRVFRNLLIFSTHGAKTDLIDAPESELAKLGELASKTDSHTLIEIMEILVHGESTLKDSPSKRIILELLLLKAVQRREALNIDTVIQHLIKVRDSLTGLGAEGQNQLSASSPGTQNPSLDKTKELLQKNLPPIKDPPPFDIPNNTTTSKVTSSADLNELWQRVLTDISQESPFTASFLSRTKLQSVANGRIKIGYSTSDQDLLPAIDNKRTQELLQKALEKAGIHVRRIDFVGLSNGNPQEEQSVPSTPVPSPKATFLNDPLIQHALEVFRAQIVQAPTTQSHLTSLDGGNNSP